MIAVYILKSIRDGGFYIGQTNNLRNRLKRHESGQVYSTKNRRPLHLIRVEEFVGRKEAMNREAYLKSLKGGNEFKKIIGIKANEL